MIHCNFKSLHKYSSQLIPTVICTSTIPNWFPKSFAQVQFTIDFQCHSHKYSSHLIPKVNPASTVPNWFPVIPTSTVPNWFPQSFPQLQFPIDHTSTVRNWFPKPFPQVQFPIDFQCHFHKYSFQVIPRVILTRLLVKYNSIINNSWNAFLNSGL